MKIRTVPVHGFSAPKLDWRLPKLGRMCAFPRTPPKRMLRQCFRHCVRMFTCSDILTSDLGTALIENYVHDKFFVVVAFHEIQ